MYFLYIILIISLSFELLYPSGIDEFQVKRFTFRDGLPENEVIFIMKDKIGFYWLLTHSGVVRFDGLNFYTFGKEKYENDIKQVFFSCFQINDDTIIFISSDNKLWQYSYNSGIFSNLSIKQSLSNYKFYCGILTKNNTLLFAVENGLLETSIDFVQTGFYDFDFNNRSNKYPFKPTFIKEDKNNNFWMNWFETGLILFDYKNKKFVDKINNQLFESNVFNLTSSSDNNFLTTVSQFGNLVKINTNNYKIQIIQSKNIFGKNNYAAYYNEAFSDSELFIGTNSGLILLNTKSLAYQIFKHNDENSNSLTENTITYIFRDRHSWWFATPNGLNIFNNSQKKFVTKRFENIASLKNSNPEILYTFNCGNLIWYLTIKGLIVENSVTGKTYYYLNNISKLPINQMILRYMIKDSDDYYWIATWGDGVIRFKLQKEFQPGDEIDFDFFYYNEKISSTISGNYLSYIIEDKQKNIWISTWGSGLSLLSNTEKTKNNPKFLRIQKKYGFNILSDFIGALTFDNNQNLLMTSSNGFLKMKTKDYTFERILLDKNDTIKHINNPQFLTEDYDGGIVLSSFSGIAKIIFNSNNNYNIEIYKLELPYSLRQLIVDDKGIIWFGSNVSYLYSFDRFTNQLRRYDFSNEVSGFSFGFSYPSKDDKKNIYFKTISFSTESLIRQTTNQKLYFRSVYVNNLERNLNLDPTKLQLLELNYKENNLKIELYLVNSNLNDGYEIRYRFRNKSFDWIKLNKPELFLASLEPGTYEIEFNASDLSGVWSKENLTLSVIISPPFWNEIWFRILVSVVMLIIITFNIKTRLKRIRNEKETIQKFTQRLINSQEEERARVSRELHDSVGQNLIVLKNLLKYNFKNHQEENPSLNQLNNMLDESLDELRNISTSLHPHQLRRLGFKLTIEAMLNKLNNLSVNGITFYFNIEIDNLPAPYDINVYRIIQESINNVIKHSKAKKCYVQVKKQNDFIELSVEDDGIGFDPSSKNSGLGLVGIRERTSLINAELFVDSTSSGTHIKLKFKVS